MTKCDLVDDARLGTCRSEIEALIKDTFLQGALDFSNSRSGSDRYGASLLAHLEQTAATHNESQRDESFRLPLTGLMVSAGVVVTGTVHCGSVKVGDQLSHFPSGKDLRVRSSTRTGHRVRYCQERGSLCLKHRRGVLGGRKSGVTGFAPDPALALAQ